MSSIFRLKGKKSLGNADVRNIYAGDHLDNVGFNKVWKSLVFGYFKGEHSATTNLYHPLYRLYEEDKIIK